MHYTSIHIFSRYINSTLTLKINKQLMCRILLTIASTIYMLQLQEVRLVTSCSLVFVQSTFSWSKHWEIIFLFVQYIVKHKLVMIKVNARVLQLVKHHDCSIYFRYSITRAHTYVIMILCVPIATHGYLTS